MIKMTEQEVVKSIPTKELKGEHHLNCSNCDSALAHITVTEKLNAKTCVRAECPFCGDHSDIVEVEGLFNVGCVENTQLVDLSEIVIAGFPVQLIILGRTK